MLKIFILMILVLNLFWRINMARGIARTGQDKAGAVIIGVLAPTVFANGTPVSVVGDPVQGHGKPPHAAPVMAAGSGNVFAHGIPVCRLGDPATCGHPASASDNAHIN
jgi:uncharacterized Zn-binding protein involved in type VI secretion